MPWYPPYDPYHHPPPPSPPPCPHHGGPGGRIGVIALLVIVFIIVFPGLREFFGELGSSIKQEVSDGPPEILGIGMEEIKALFWVFCLAIAFGVVIRLARKV